jgi:hypothetical protein
MRPCDELAHFSQWAALAVLGGDGAADDTQERETAEDKGGSAGPTSRLS